VNRASAAIAAKAGERFYLPELDALRFFAFLSVFIAHLDLPRIVKAAGRSIMGRLALALTGPGAFGVDLFFTLSAYLITTLLLKERAKSGTVDVKAFYVRRILRIWPLYFLLLACAFILSHLAPNQFGVARIYFIAYLLLVGNFAQSIYGPPGSFVGPLWSISVEEQFYLLWPLAMSRVSRRELTRIALGMLLLASLARFVMLACGSGREAIWNCTFTRLDPIAAGILVAAAPYESIAGLKLRTRAGLALAGYLVWILVAHWCGMNPATFVSATIGYPAIAAGSAAFVIAALGAPAVGARFMLNDGLIYLGRISYGLYMFHMLALTVVQFPTGMAGRAAVGGLNSHSFIAAAAIRLVLTLGATVVLAAISYRWFETPFLRLKSRYARIESRPV
jgi:peptidoglycan/LPS O-acetylase OafA/YrhL